jgi:hypothetical protein
VARNLLAENQSVRRAQDASTYILGWIAQAVAIIGGVYAARSWPGNTIRWTLELIPWTWVIPTALFIGFVAWAIDIINDLTPNQVAITYGFLGPILATGTNGTLASRIRDWSQMLQDSLGDKIGQWAGNPGAGAMAIICIASAVLIGRRVLAKQQGGAAAAAGGARPGGGR